MSSEILLRLRGVTQRYTDNPAIRGIDFDLRAGEIHALIGDHKSGKSTLARLIGGVEPTQEGELIVDGVALDRLTPRKAKRARIAIVQESVSVIPTLSAIRNVTTGNLPGFFVHRQDEERLRERCRYYLDRLGMSFDLNVPIRRLTDEQQQVIELIRVFAQDPAIVVLDEISSRLKPQRLKQLFSVLRELKEEGRGILYITADIEEIFQFADRVTVLRDGTRMGTEFVKDLDRVRLVRMAYDFTSYLQEPKEEGSSVYLRRYNEQLVKNLPIGAVVLDGDQRVYSVNIEAEKILGMEGLKPGKSSVRELLEHLEIEKPEEMLEAFARRERKSWDGVAISGNRTARIASFPAKSFDEESLGTILFIEDVSMDDMVREYLTRAEQMSSIAELAAGVAHEINNPLGIIQNYLELLRVAMDDAERAEYLGRIEGEVNLITEVVSSLLSFSRVKQLPPRRVNPVQILEEVLLLIGHRLTEKSITVERSVRKTPVYIEGIENKLKQLFVNIITNALDAMLDGGTLRIEVGADFEHRQVRVSISDTGHGIPLDIQEEIFVPFFSTKLTKNNTGLGLAVCQHIIDLHNGVITFESRPGQTTFNIVLPIVDSAVPGSVGSDTLVGSNPRSS